MKLISGILFCSAVLLVSSAAIAKGNPAAVPVRAAKPPQAASTAAAPAPMMATMQQELDREIGTLGKADPPAYFVGYTVTDSNHATVAGSNGALLSSDVEHTRWLEAQVRVGTYDFDNTHRVAGGQDEPGSFGEPVPIEDDAAVLRRAIWRETDAQYRAASQGYIKLKTSKEVQAQTAEEAAPDFSKEKAHVFTGPFVSFTLDRRPWEEKSRQYTKFFRASPSILNSIVTFTAQADNEYQVTSEGTRLQFGQVRYRLEIFLQGKAPDGMDINRYYNFDWTDPAQQPDDKTVLAQCAILQKELEGLVQAPLVEPIAGPVLMTGRAAAVFFHEVFGHRDEGFRQKDSNEGQTFARKVGEAIMPSFITVVDDPTESKLGSNVLLGFYPFDDEGVAAQRVTLVDKGVLRGFEMSRQPLVGFAVSNGHGRRQVGLPPVSRQGNLIVESSHQVSNDELRKMLVEEVKRQGKPFGLMIDDIAGGFTFTGRGQPQAFQEEPLVVYEVFADGRPDLLVRGVNIVGTPLTSLAKIVATGDKTETFNGYCGAESGSVPVSASAPAMLMTELEVQKKETSTDRPPILPVPSHDPQAQGGKL